MEVRMSSQSSTGDLACQVPPSSSVEIFLQHGLYLRNWSPRTVRAYRHALTDLPGHITKPALDAWIVSCRQKQYTPGGMNVRIRSLNSYLSWLRAEWPTVNVPPPLK